MVEKLVIPTLDVLVKIAFVRLDLVEMEETAMVSLPLVN